METFRVFAGPNCHIYRRRYMRLYGIDAGDMHISDQIVCFHENPVYTSASLYLLKTILFKYAFNLFYMAETITFADYILPLLFFNAGSKINTFASSASLFMNPVSFITRI